MKQAILLVVSHVCVLAAGFALGVYALPLPHPYRPYCTHASRNLASSEPKHLQGENAHTQRHTKDCLPLMKAHRLMKTPNYSYAAESAA